MLIVGPDPNYYNDMYKRIGDALDMTLRLSEAHKAREEAEFQRTMEMLKDAPGLATTAYGDQVLSKYGKDRPEAAALIMALRQKANDDDAMKRMVGETLSRSDQISKDRATRLDAIPPARLTPTEPDPLPMVANPAPGAPRPIPDSYAYDTTPGPLPAQPTDPVPGLDALLAGQRDPRASVTPASVQNMDDVASGRAELEANPDYRNERIQQQTGPTALWEAFSALPDDQKIIYAHLAKQAGLPVPTPPAQIKISALPQTVQSTALFHGWGSDLTTEASDIASNLQTGAKEDAAGQRQKESSAAALQRTQESDRLARERAALSDKLARQRMLDRQKFEREMKDRNQGGKRNQGHNQEERTAIKEGVFGDALEREKFSGQSRAQRDFEQRKKLGKLQDGEQPPVSMKSAWADELVYKALLLERKADPKTMPKANHWDTLLYEKQKYEAMVRSGMTPLDAFRAVSREYDDLLGPR